MNDGKQNKPVRIADLENPGVGPHGGIVVTGPNEQPVPADLSPQDLLGIKQAGPLGTEIATGGGGGE